MFPDRDLLLVGPRARARKRRVFNPSLRLVKDAHHRTDRHEVAGALARNVEAWDGSAIEK